MNTEEGRLIEFRLTRLENDIDLLEIAISRFDELVTNLAQLSHLIRTAFLESRIWEELEEYRHDDGKKHRSNRTTGFDVERKPKGPAE